jgi:hypothetical protein
MYSSHLLLAAMIGQSSTTMVVCGSGLMAGLTALGACYPNQTPAIAGGLEARGVSCSSPHVDQG